MNNLSLMGSYYAPAEQWEETGKFRIAIHM